jgi:hypothetical protein
MCGVNAFSTLMSCPERLLLFALRACLERPRRGRAPELQAAHWESVADLAGETALSFQVLQAGDVTAAGQGPAGWIDALRMHIRHTTVRNALQHRRLKELLAACEREAIPVMLTKGLWLVHCVYRDAAARDSGDIDLLFRPEDMARFTEVARELGYEVPADGASLSARAHSTNEFSLRHPDGGLLVDVHWSLTNPATETPVDERRLWERSELVDIASVACRTLNLEDHLLYLCFHAAMHHKFWAVGPRCLYDVAMVVRQPPRPIRWNELTARAHALGWGRAAWLMFALIDEHLGVQVPADVMQALHRASPADGRVRQLALEAIFAAREQQSLYRHMARLLAPGTSGRRLSHLRLLLLPSRVQMTNQFGAATETPTWRLHAKRWTSKLRDWAPEVGALLAGSRTHRQELTRTRQIQQWLDASA